MSLSYEQFILSKIPRAEQTGFTPLSPAHPSLSGQHQFQADIALWMCRGGRRANFSSFGLGKTRTHLQVAIWCVENQPGKKYLITCPLGVRHQFIQEDGPAMGVGMPEYVLLFRKPQSDTSTAYADLPVTKDKDVYTRANWQVDAASFWKSDGNRLPDPEILAAMPIENVRKLWIEHARKHQYQWQEHVEIAKELENRGSLPASFMLFPPISNHPGVWSDIARMRVLNSEQSKRNEENHVCPLQLDIVKRLIGRYSNPGEIVLDPFAGIFTVPYCAIHMGRVGWGVELSHDYWRCGTGYCEQAEREHCMPTLFDMQRSGLKAVNTNEEAA